MCSVKFHQLVVQKYLLGKRGYYYSVLQKSLHMQSIKL
jgi:hypothetical protein